MPISRIIIKINDLGGCSPTPKGPEKVVETISCQEIRLNFLEIFYNYFAGFAFVGEGLGRFALR